MSAVGLLCRIMFIRAKPLVAASFSCPYNVTFAVASSPTFKSNEPDPQVGSYTVVSLLVFAPLMPMIETCQRRRLPHPRPKAPAQDHLRLSRSRCRRRNRHEAQSRGLRTLSIHAAPSAADD